MTLSNDSSNRFSLEITRQLDELCDEFEKLIERRDPPILASFLNRVDDSVRDYLLTELIGIATEHLEFQEHGNPQQALLAANPELSSRIKQVFRESQEATIDHQPQTSARQAVPATPRRRQSRGLLIRCPHCSNHVELITDTTLDSIDCTVCGSNFSLVDHSRETRMAEALQQINRFELVSRLGVGGFGTVWKARDTELDRVVAIKIPRHWKLSADEMEQFFREARSAAQLRHPNIVPVHEVGREGDAVFIVSDLIRGVSLADKLSGDRLTFNETARLCKTIAEALEHAHRHGVIHRDLKPANIMIDQAGQPFLMDFGLAKRDAGEVTMTVEGQLVGTPAYMSPEQAEGKSAWADRRADIYSMGVILFECLAGELPFRGNAQMQMHHRMTGDAPNARSLNSHIPIDLATIAAKCLEREPGRRYQTAQELSNELERFLEKRPIQARPLSPIEKGFRWAVRKPLHALSAGLLVFLAIAGPAVAVVIHQQRHRLVSEMTKNENLVKVRERERQDALSDATTLRSELSLWEGKATPSEVWPPDSDYSPKDMQLAGLLAARLDELGSPTKSADETQLQFAKRLIALGTLHYSGGRREQALAAFEESTQTLEVMYDANPKSAPLALALGDVYRRISELVTASAPDQTRQWLGKALKVIEKSSKQNPLDPRILAELQELQLRMSVADGFQEASKRFETLSQLDAHLRGLWPTSPDRIYSLSCELAGRPTYLDEVSDE